MTEAPLPLRWKILLGTVPVLAAMIGAVAGLFLAVVNPLATKMIRPNDPIPKVLAHLYCSPTETEVGKAIRCTNQSEYATGFIWDFGDGTEPVTKKDTQAVDHTFHSAGRWTVQLMAHNKAGRDTASLEVTVAPPPPDFIPSEVSVTMTFHPDLEERTRVLDIDELMEQPAGVSEPQIKSFPRRVHASPGYRIVQAEFASTHQHSARHTYIDGQGLTRELPPNPEVQVLDDGSSARLTVYLRTSPEKDGSTAWVKGSLTVREKRAGSVPAEISKTLSIDHFGPYFIARAIGDMVPVRFRLADAEGRQLAEGKVGETLRWPATKLKFSLQIGGSTYQLQVDRMLDLPSDLRQSPTP